ncbi:anti-sigma factor [Parashewanella curva]|uniref:Anti-sigma-E factor RseA n=1 Tax=Parashewanella curva TaxID=2338552 RepID=A0A3L8PU27_9GAMM|nr:anti sigma-E factor RseA C-terminal domain-containing protein [Parashewanella curva]RLV57918.1 anti-sigma factor [Parashewanella curva]
MDKLDQEWLSAAVDGDIDEQAIKALSNDSYAQDKWCNYHLIGDAIRDELPDAIPLDLTAGIASALESEPELLVPQTPETKVTVEEPLVANAKVVPLFKQVGQYAIAASVAVMAVIGVQNYQQVEQENHPSPVLNTLPIMGSASPVSLQAEPSSNAVSAQEYNEQLQEQRRRINAYLQDHLLQQRLNSNSSLSQNSDN